MRDELASWGRPMPKQVMAMKELLDRGYGRTQPLAGDAAGPLIVDFRWADSTPVFPLPPQPLTIEAAVEQDREDDDVEAPPALRDFTGSLPDPDRC
jgi:hypothetical protein